MSMNQETNLGEVLARLAQDPRVRDLELSPSEAEAFTERVVEMAKHLHVPTVPMDKAMRALEDSIQRNAGAYKKLADL